MEVSLNGGELYNRLLLYLIFSFSSKLYLCAVDSQFQSRQCQDLLENNLAHKRPIEGLFVPFILLIGKKNLEVRPTAVNKI